MLSISTLTLRYLEDGVPVEFCREGDVLVVAPTAPCDAGYFGELLASSWAPSSAPDGMRPTEPIPG